MKTLSTIFALCAFMVMISSRAEAQSGVTDSDIAPTLKGVSESSDGVENYRTFEFDVATSGDYYARFWLQPATYRDGSFTRYKVFVNSVYVGEIVPTDNRWQSAPIADCPTVMLTEGVNSISVSTVAPEFPEVESIRLSIDAENAEHPSDAYDSFMQSALGAVSDITEYASNGIGEYALSTNSDTGGTFQNIPLKYSFYRTYSFTANQEISVSSTSETPHVIDIFYYGKQELVATDPISPIIPVNSVSETTGCVIDTADFVPYPSIPGLDKITIAYISATPDEIQGLNWKAVSERTSDNTGIYSASKTITIPVTGLYMIKLRSATDRTLGVADVTVNGLYSYEDSPIYYAKVSYSIPDNAGYAVMTVKDDGDPMLFIEGNDAERIVGYNDDAPSDSASAYSLTTYDSFVFQSYHIRTTGMHVCNFSTLNPESTCTVMVGTPENSNLGSNVYSLKNHREESAGLSDVYAENNATIFPSPASISQPVTIIDSGTIHRVKIYGLCGTMVADIAADNSVMTFTPSEHNIIRGGIYIFTVETENGMSVYKIPLF